MAVRDQSQGGVAVPAYAAVEGRDLTRVYGEGETAVEALRGVDIDVRSGELVAVMGPSGSGKSTLMHILAGLDKPTSGTVMIAGTEITRLDDSQLTLLRRQHIGFVFQFFNLLPMLNAEENVVLPLSIAGEKPDKRLARLAPGADGPRRPAQPPAVRALGRPAAARRDRPLARHAADDPLRRRADGQPRLEDGRRDPRAHARPRPTPTARRP